MKRTIHKTMLLGALLMFSGIASADSGTVVSVQPTSTTVAPGGTATIDINVSNVSDLYAYQFDVFFGPDVVSATSEVEGTFLLGGGPTFFIPGTVDNVGGGVTATGDTLISAVRGVDGSGTLAVLTFTGLAPAMTTIDLENVILLDSNLNLIDFTTDNASVTVQSSVVPAPEPSTTLLLVLGVLSIVCLAKRRNAGSVGRSRSNRQFAVGR